MSVHCSKSRHAIGQTKSSMFWFPGNNESFHRCIDHRCRKLSVEGKNTLLRRIFIHFTESSKDNGCTRSPARKRYQIIRRKRRFSWEKMRSYRQKVPALVWWKSCKVFRVTRWIWLKPQKISRQPSRTFTKIFYSDKIRMWQPNKVVRPTRRPNKRCKCLAHIGRK